MLNIRLSRVQAEIPTTDPMHRTWVGWTPTQSDEDTYQQNRGVYLLGPRADDERYATFSYRGQVVTAVAIEGFDSYESLVPGGKAKRAIIGWVLPPTHRAHAPLLGVPIPAGKNPVGYFPDPPDL